MRARTSRRVPGGRSNGAIGLIALCIVVPSVLLALRSPEPATAAAAPTAYGIRAANPDPPTEAVATSLASAATSPVTERAQAAPSVPTVTIEGCLEQFEHGFRLKDTAGDAAPRGRSWKSGFLRRGAKPIIVSDAPHRLNLSRHVGERVTVTGTLDDRELQGASIERLAEACS